MSYPIHATDNITYGVGNSEKAIDGVAGDHGNNIHYEVPVDGTMNKSGDNEYDMSGAIYAVPNEYEYATFGPNEMVMYTISNIIIMMYGVCSPPVKIDITCI